MVSNGHASGPSVLGLRDVKTGPPETKGDHIANRLFVFYDQNTSGSHRLHPFKIAETIKREVYYNSVTHGTSDDNPKISAMRPCGARCDLITQINRFQQMGLHRRPLRQRSDALVHNIAGIRQCILKTIGRASQRFPQRGVRSVSVPGQNQPIAPL
jgi:hypothetical protein